MFKIKCKFIETTTEIIFQVIVIDWNKAATKSHPQNALILKKWKGADDDTALLDLANLLQSKYSALTHHTFEQAILVDSTLTTKYEGGFKGDKST